MGTMSQQYIITRTEADAISLTNKMAELIGSPVTGIYQGQPAPPDKQKSIRWDTPREITGGPNAGKWAVIDAKGNWYSSQQKSALTRWLNQNIKGYAREVYDPNWFA